MSTTHKIHCREHGGYFIRPAQRGRPPVRCPDNNQCDAAHGIPEFVPTEDKAPLAKARTKLTQRVNAKAAGRKLRGSDTRDPVQRAASAKAVAEVTAERHPEIVSKPRSQPSKSLTKAQQAKAQLEVLGWTVLGKGSGDTAAITATRGIELLIITWKNGLQHQAEYSLWDTDSTAKQNGRPNRNLPFDPDEIPDKELVQLLAGTHVKWFNKLAGKEEDGYVSPKSIEILHMYDGHGDETPGARMVRFAEASGSGFRAFRLDALIKVG